MAESYPLSEGTLADHCQKLIAHLYTECNSMTEWCDWQPGKMTNDAGWAFGMAQYHIYYRFNDWLKEKGFVFKPNNPWYAELVRYQFFKDHPQFTTWQGQMKKYLTDMQGITNKNIERGYAPQYAVERAIDSWNTHPHYLGRVLNNVIIAKDFLSMVDSQ